MDVNLSDLLAQRIPQASRDLLRRVATLADAAGWRAYLVGGPVRDLLLGLPALDLDLTVVGDAQALAARLAEAAGGRVVHRSQFGTAAVRVGGLHLDLASARSECYPHPGALPSVRPGSLQDDLLRRDFTINAMAVALAAADWGSLVDPFGGRSDLSARRIRVLHDRSFQDDPTRMLRAARYAARLGFALAPETEALARRDGPFLERVSGDRRWKELHRLLSEPQPETALLQAQALGLLPHVHASLQAGDWTARAFAAARESRLGAPSPAVHLCLLAFRSSTSERQDLARGLRLPASVTTALSDAQRLREMESELSDPEARPSRAVALLNGLSLQAVFAGAVALESREAREVLRAYLARWRQTRSRLSGDALMAMGVPQGPELGRYLRALRKARLDGEAPSEEAERRLVRRWLESGEPDAGESEHSA